MLWLLLLGVLLLLMLLVPVSVEISVRTEGGLTVEAIPRWGGLSAAGFRSSRGRQTSSPDERRAQKRGTRPPRSSRRNQGSFRKLRALLKSDDFLASLVRWMGRLVRVLRPRDVRVHLRFGTGDPCDTGQLWGVLSSFFVPLPDKSRANIMLEPDFGDAVFDLDARAEVRFAPLVLLLVSLGYFVTPPAWRALGNYLRA